MKYFRFIFIMTVLVFFSCKDKYKTVPNQVTNTNLESTNQVVNPDASKLHTVVVNEILPTANYTYLNVTEGEKTFWIAVSSTNAEVGGTYFYVGGLFKNNFESKALNRVFDELYLVGNLVSSKHGEQAGTVTANNSEVKELAAKSEKIHITPQKGSIKISEIVDNQKKYEGQTVQIDGECTKINIGIMGKNWIHLKDGSKDDFDLVITSDEMIDVGSVVTIKAQVVLNKDFGAGYTYDLILENGAIVKK